MRRDAGDIELKNGLLFSLFGHGQRRQQRWKHGKPEYENARAEELLGGTAGVIPEAYGCLHGPRLRRSRRTLIERARYLARIAGHQFGGIGIGAIDEQLHG